MNPSPAPRSNRRDFLKNTSTLIAGASALTAGVAIPRGAYAAESNTIQLALVGCGGRGGGAVVNALSTKAGPVKLVAMADVFEQNIKTHYASVKKAFADTVDVPPERQFVGFDGYRKAIDCLKPGDVVILTTPPAFRWVHFKYAIDKGVNVFMEKPVTVDGPTTRRMYDLADLSIDKNLKVGVGLMCRHCEARGELFNRIKLGQIGDVIAMRCYRMHGPVADCFTNANPAGGEIDVRNILGVTTTLKKSDIKERGNRDISVMPEGLMAKLTPADLASILAYLESLPAK